MIVDMLRRNWTETQRHSDLGIYWKYYRNPYLTEVYASANVSLLVLPR